jgi:oxygen-dependent protoporphyrinogen oxidase
VIAIVGAGITGLAAAYDLVSRGVPCRVLEAASRAGGLILTEHAGGFTIEAGPDSVVAQKPAAIALCEELGLAPKLVSVSAPRTAYVLKRGRLHPLPSPSILGIPLSLAGIARYDLLPLHARARLALEPLVPRGKAADESVAKFFRRRFGGATVDLVAEPLLGGIHAGDIESLSLPSLFPRLASAEAEHRSVLRAFARTHQPTGGTFQSLSSGMGELVFAIERRLPANTIAYDSPVDQISRVEGRWRVSSRGSSVDADAVVLALPAPAAARLLAPIDPQAAALCAEVPYVSTVSVALAYPRGAVAHPLDGSGFVVARRYNDLRITACTWVSSKWPGRAPAGQVLLRAFVGGSHDPGAVDLADDELAGLAAREIGRVLGITGEPGLARVHRWRQAGAQHNVGHVARMAALEARLAGLPGLLVAGSGFRSIGIPDCIADGRAAAHTAAPPTAPPTADCRLQTAD